MGPLVRDEVGAPAEALAVSLGAPEGPPRLQDPLVGDEAGAEAEAFAAVPALVGLLPGVRVWCLLKLEPSRSSCRTRRICSISRPCGSAVGDEVGLSAEGFPTIGTLVGFSPR